MVATGLMLAVGSVLPISADAAWQASQAVGADVVDAGSLPYSDMVVDSGGRGLIVWTATDGIRSSRFDLANRTWGASETISSAGSRAVLAGNANGNVVLGWIDNAGSSSAVRRARVTTLQSANWTSDLPTYSYGSGMPMVAIDAAGNAAVTHTTLSGRTYNAVFDLAGSSWLQLGDGWGNSDSSSPSVIAGPDGTFTFAPNAAGLDSRSYTIGTGWSSAGFSGGPVFSSCGSVAFRACHIVGDQTGGHARLTISAGRAYVVRNSASSTIETRNLSVESSTVSEIWMAGNPSGDLIAVWLRSTGVASEVLEAVSFTASTSTWSTTQAIRTGSDLTRPVVDMDASGNAVVAWVDNETNVMAVEYRAATGAWGAPQTVGDVGADCCRPVEAASIAGGHSRVMWRSGTDLRVAESGVPGAPVLSGVTPSNGAVAVSWAGNADSGASAVTRYDAVAEPGGHSCQWTSGPTQCSITGLTNGQTYTVTVTARNAIGTSAASSGSAATPRTIPGSPSVSGAVVGNGQVAVSWSPPSDNGGATITGYTVTSSPEGRVCSTSSTAPATPVTSCTVTGLTNGQAYTFTVTASNEAGAGSASSASSSATPRTIPGAATGVVGTAGNTEVLVEWSPAANGGATITGYAVTANPGGQQCAWTTGPLRCTVSGLANGTAYTFTVVATNAAGPGPASTASSPVAPRTTPGVPTGVTATPGNTEALVSWTAPASTGGEAISGYTVTASPGGAQCAWTSGPLRCTVAGLSNGQAYTFTVTAANSAGSGSASVASTAVTPRAVPEAPTGVQVVHGNGSIEVRWVAPSSNGGSSIVSYTATADPGGRTCQWTTGDLQCTISGLTNGEAYTATVVATSGAGSSLPSAASASATPRTVPGAPTGVSATAGSRSATVSWSAPSTNGGAAITSYAVTSVPAGGTCTWVSGPLSCTVAGLTDGTAYTFRVTAMNSEGAGAVGVSTTAIVPATASSGGASEGPGSVPVAPTIAGVMALRAVMTGPAAIRISYTPGTAGAQHAATCSASRHRTATVRTTGRAMRVNGLSYGKSYVCDVVSSRGGVSSTIVSTRVTMLADLPRPAGVSSASSARSGGTLTVAWRTPATAKWVRVVQRAELRAGSGVVAAKAVARRRAGKRKLAVIAVPRSAASGSYSLCVVFEDPRWSDNREVTCRKISVKRPAGGGSTGSGGSPSRPTIGPIVL